MVYDLKDTKMNVEEIVRKIEASEDLYFLIHNQIPLVHRGVTRRVVDLEDHSNIIQITNGLRIYWKPKDTGALEEGVYSAIEATLGSASRIRIPGSGPGRKLKHMRYDFVPSDFLNSRTIESTFIYPSSVFSYPNAQYGKHYSKLASLRQ